MLSCLLLLLVLAEPLDEAPPHIPLKEVPKYVGQTVNVCFYVRSLNTSQRALLILNSKDRYGEPGNFAVLILRENAREFAEADLIRPATVTARFRHQLVYATGKIYKEDNGYFMIVTRHSDLRSDENRG